MTEASYKCVTANLEKGHKSGVEQWLREAVASSPAIVFAQEFRRKDLVEELAGTYGYQVAWPLEVNPRWWMVSWLMVRNDLAVVPPSDWLAELIRPFDSYVAAAHVELPGIGQSTLMSVHASPTPVTDADLQRWVGVLPEPRV